MVLREGFLFSLTIDLCVVALCNTIFLSQHGAHVRRRARAFSPPVRDSKVQGAPLSYSYLSNSADTQRGAVAVGKLVIQEFVRIGREGLLHRKD